MKNKQPTTREEFRNLYEQRERDFLKKCPEGSPEYIARLNKANKAIAWLMKHPINAGKG